VSHETATPAEAEPLLPAPRPGRRDELLRWLLDLGLRVSLRFSPRPAVFLIRRAFASGGGTTGRILDRHAPTAGLDVLVDEPYGSGPDELLDVVRPAGTTAALPLVVWIHGGAWVGGTKDELRGFGRIVANLGYVVALPRYSLAPERRYPTPLRQLMAALAYLQAKTARYGLDPGRIVIGGDSAGAQLAAQLATIVTTPGYGEAVGVAPTIDAGELRGVVLACGPYDLELARHAGSETGRRLIDAVLWAYTGRRNPMDDPAFAGWSITDNLTASFPPALITAGNADPLRAHSELLAERLSTVGADVETQFFPSDHEPPLGHEYQFNLDLADAQAFLDRLTGFLARRLDPEPSTSGTLAP
jgi:acetyl esterase/lipase